MNYLRDELYIPSDENSVGIYSLYKCLVNENKSLMSAQQRLSEYLLK